MQNLAAKINLRPAVKATPDKVCAEVLSVTTQVERQGSGRSFDGHGRRGAVWPRNGRIAAKDIVIVYGVLSSGLPQSGQHRLRRLEFQRQV